MYCEEIFIKINYLRDWFEAYFQVLLFIGSSLNKIYSRLRQL